MAPQQVTGSRGSSHTAWWPGGLEGTGPLPARAPGGKLRAQGVRGSPGHGAAACSAVCISVETTGLSHQRWDLGWGECRSSPPPPPPHRRAPLLLRLGAGAPPWAGPPLLPQHAASCGAWRTDGAAPRLGGPAVWAQRRLCGYPGQGVPQGGRSCPRESVTRTQ